MEDQRACRSWLFGCFSNPKMKSHKGCQILLPTKIVGKQCENIWATVMENNNSHVISIQGRIGVGKTTLLTYLNNQFLRNSSYHFVIFVQSGSNFSTTPSALQGEIATQIGLSKTPGWNQKGIHQKGVAIHNLLSRKRYALLIDDFRGVKGGFGDLGLPLPNSTNQCKIVLVASHDYDYDLHHHSFADTRIQAMPLAWDDTWILFRHEVGGVDSEISSLAVQIAILCQGLPKALVKIGSVIQYNTEWKQWKHAIEVLEKSVPGKEYNEDLAQILYDELGRDDMFKARVKAQMSKPELTNRFVNDRLCKISRGLGELKSNLAQLSDYEIKKQLLEIVDRLASYICEIY